MDSRPDILDTPLDGALGGRSDAAQLEGDAFVREHGDWVAVGVSCDIAKKHVTPSIGNGFSSQPGAEQGRRRLRAIVLGLTLQVPRRNRKVY